MTTRFLQSGLWSRIASLARKAKRRYVAVAYLGARATKLLPLGKGDVLVVDMSITAVRAGQTNPAEVAEYLKRGVEVHSCSNLHAKVFVFDNKAVIGSTNVSENSQHNLIEAALLTTDADVVSSARGFVLSLIGERVTPAYVKSCKKEYHPSGRGRKGNSSTPAHPRLWVQRIYPADFDAQENRLDQSGRKAAKKKLRNRRDYEVETISYNEKTSVARKAGLGDIIIQVWQEDDGELQVYPPCRIVLIKSYVSSRDTKRRKLVFLESPKPPKVLKWKAIRDTLKKAGIARVSDHIDREIVRADVKHQLIGLWPTLHSE